MWWILCDITGEDLWGTWWLSSSLPKLHFYGVCKTNHLCLIPAETRSKWRCRRSHLHGSWQFCTRAFCICHRYSCIHTSSMCTHSDVPRWSVSPLILTGCLLVCRCLHHPRWCGGGDHRWLSGLQHPMHHWCLRDLCWTGVCEREEWLTAVTVSFCLFIDCRASHVSHLRGNEAICFSFLRTGFSESGELNCRCNQKVFCKYVNCNSRDTFCEFLGGDADLVGCFQGFLLLHPVCCGSDCSKLLHVFINEYLPWLCCNQKIIISFYFSVHLWWEDSLVSCAFNHIYSEVV